MQVPQMIGSNAEPVEHGFFQCVLGMIKRKMYIGESQHEGRPGKKWAEPAMQTHRRAAGRQPLYPKLTVQACPGLTGEAFEHHPGHHPEYLNRTLRPVYRLHPRHQIHRMRLTMLGILMIRIYPHHFYPRWLA